MDPARIEKMFMLLTATMLAAFLGALGYASWGMGMHLPGRAGEVATAAVRSTPPFDEPGVYEIAPGEYDVVVLGHAWAFEPREIRVPVGARVRFRATSADVIHGFHIEATRVNAMLIPGQVTEVVYTFDAPGEHLVICHEYCGVGHQLMSGKVIVE